MRVILMRHADAGDPDSRRWPDDRDRPLTDEGRREHRAVSRALRRMSVRFDVLLSSPLVRARQTAEITAELYGGPDSIEATAALGDRGTPDALLARLSRCERDTTALCVGHEPLLSRLAAILVTGSDRARIEMRKSGVIAIDFRGHPEPGGGTLVFHLPPREIGRLMDEGES